MLYVVGSNEITWVHRNVENEGGGILTMWSNRVFQCRRVEESKGFIVTEGEYNIGRGWGSQAVSVGFINVYSSCSIKDKIALWAELNVLSPGT